MESSLQDTIIGSSTPIVKLREYVRKVARSEANVLITGETGTGKERVAELVHRASPRSDKPFVCLNCAAIPESLLESELFGYERGAFTGANEPALGKLRMAGNGTVFLDEIGEMTLTAQAKLLRVIESREVFPLGARQTIPIDARFVAATNQDLEPLIAGNRFRKDLYYRLNVARLYLPALKEHKEDIADLFMHYVSEFNRRYGYKVQGPTTELMARLIDYDWPGNVREVRNLVEAIFIDPPSGPISLMDIPESFRSIFGRQATTAVTERARLLSVLQDTNWNKTKAAARLNWSRMTLYRKLSRYQINNSIG